MITAMPEIKTYKLGPETPFLFIACDGIWDCLTSQEGVEFVNENLPKKTKVSQVVEDVFEKIIASDVASSGGIGCDNMTAIVISFNNQ